MKVLIESRSNGKYLTAEDMWTRNRDEARDFRQSAAAIQHCIRAKLSDVYVKLAFRDSGLDVRLDPFPTDSKGSAQARDTRGNGR